MFNENSAIVNIWIKAINDPKSNYSLADVPRLSNLYDVVRLIVSPDS